MTVKQACQISECRGCQSQNIIPVLSFTPTALCESYSKIPTEEHIYPLEICLCTNCCLAQLQHAIPHENVFANYYLYPSSVVRDSRYTASYVTNVLDRRNGIGNLFVVQVGSHNGGLLNSFKESHCHVIGIESNDRLVKIAKSNGIETKLGRFTPEIVEVIVREYGKADVILVDNSFGYQHPGHIANTDELRQYVRALSSLAKNDGLVVVQTNDIVKMINQRVFDLFYHEHCSYFSKDSISNLFIDQSLSLVDIDTIDSSSISSRYFFRKIAPEVKLREEGLQDVEPNQSIHLCTKQPYKILRDQITEQKQKLISKLKTYKDQRIVGYGASASSTTLIYEFGLAEYLEFLVDDNPEKVGSYSPGWNLLVREVGSLYSENIDLILILAWRFEDAIKKSHPDLVSKMLVANLLSDHSS